MDGNCKLNYKISDASSIYLHDSRIFSMDFDDNSISIRFPQGIFLAKDGSKTKEALIKLLIKPDDINVYISKKIGRKKIKYITKYIDLIRFIKYLNYRQIEIIDVMNQGQNHYLWRGVFIKNNKYLDLYVEIQFISCNAIQWEIYYDI